MAASVTLESISARVSSGGTPSRKNAEYFSSDATGHLWVKSKELLDCAIEDTEERITDDGLQHSSAKYFPAHTVLIAMYGANVGQLGWLRQPATVNQAICGLVIDEHKADWRFVFYSLLLNRGDLTVQAQGAAQQNLNQDLIRQFAISLPPLPIQQRIAGILSAYDELIENSQRRIKILEAMARALYREWFVHFRFPGHEHHPHVASPLGEIPQGWEAIAFTEIADVLSGGTPKTSTPEYWDGDIPFFTPRDAPDCFYVEDADKHVTELGLSKCASQLYLPDTVFITARGTVGKVALPSVPMAMNQSCYALRGKPGISQRFLFLMTLQQVEYLKTNTGGATFDTIVVDTFRRMQVAKPPHDLIAAFTRNVDAVFEQVNTLQRQVKNLRRTRDLLLPRLLSGQIDMETCEHA
ncbi:MAG: restriction endonuclease subunit S [Rhodocyclales bacterium]|nr:restriction endonuclease subunit S [Rhodocyclales bacterium]